MIDFNNFETDRFSKLLKSLRGYTDNNLRYPKVGELVEKALDEYSNGFLTRVNQTGFDLIGADGKTYESKVTQFKNSSGMAIRSLILKNFRSADGYHNTKLADYFIISDVKNGKACCISSHSFYNKRNNGACLTASADPKPSQFFITGHNSSKDEHDYFDESENFDLKFIKSIA